MTETKTIPQPDNETSAVDQSQNQQSESGARALGKRLRAKFTEIKNRPAAKREALSNARNDAMMRQLDAERAVREAQAAGTDTRQILQELATATTNRDRLMEGVESSTPAANQYLDTRRSTVAKKVAVMAGGVATGYLSLKYGFDGGPVTDVFVGGLGTIVGGGTTIGMMESVGTGAK